MTLKPNNGTNSEVKFQKIWNFFSEEALDALTNQDADKYLRYFSDEVVFTQTGFSKPLEGITAFREWLERVFTNFRGNYKFIDICLDKGHSFKLDYVFVGTYKGEQKINLPMTVNVKVEGLKVVEANNELNLLDLRRQLAEEEENRRK